jgi:peptide/nickel transport system permease protein
MLVATSVIIFVVLRALPGNPVITRLGANSGVSPGEVARLRRQLGLDEPIAVQYWHWIAGAVRGNFGRSFFSQFSVTQLIAQRLPATLELTIASVLITLILAVPAAVLGAVRRGGLLDRLGALLSSFGIALPPFVSGIILLVVFGVHLRLLPSAGYVAISTNLGQNLRHMVLPALTLSIAQAPLVFRYLRTQLIEELSSAYARTAEGKGAPRRRVVFRHALRNALIPALTMLGLIVGYALGGVVVVEYVFGIGGLGSLAITSATERDYAVLQSIVLLVSATFITVSLLVDLAVQALDPRLRGARS